LRGWLAPPECNDSVLPFDPSSHRTIIIITPSSSESPSFLSIAQSVRRSRTLSLSLSLSLSRFISLFISAFLYFMSLSLSFSFFLSIRDGGGGGGVVDGDGGSSVAHTSARQSFCSRVPCAHTRWYVGQHHRLLPSPSPPLAPHCSLSRHRVAIHPSIHPSLSRSRIFVCSRAHVTHTSHTLPHSHCCITGIDT